MQIQISAGYANVPKVEAQLKKDGEWYKIEREVACKLLEEALETRGFEVTKTKRQKFPRIVPKSETREIEVIIEGRVCQDVLGLPKGWDYKLTDHDNEE